MKKQSGNLIDNIDIRCYIIDIRYRYSILRGERMARTKFQTLTEQMFYILLCMQQECCGMELMEQIKRITGGRIEIGAGTMYTLLGDFEKEGMIRETQVVGRKRSYVITEKGSDMLQKEYNRICIQVKDYERFGGGNQNETK